MNKKILLFLMCFFALGMTVNAERIDDDRVQSIQDIGNLYGVTYNSGECYVVDSGLDIVAGPYKTVSDYSGYCYAEDYSGNKILFDLDGTVIAETDESHDVQPPQNGIYVITEIKEQGDADFSVYDYATKKELLHTKGLFNYHLEQQPDKMFIEKDGKYAIIDSKCNFITDYIYDDVKKRFNPEYVPFPKAYAIVVQDGVTKYIDWNLNEINLDDYNGGFFITNCRHMYGNDGFTDYGDYYVLESGNRQALYDMASDKIVIPYQTEYEFMQMNNKYIIVKKGDEEAVLNHSGEIVVPYKNQRLSFTDDGLVAYYYYDGETGHDGVLSPENGETKEEPLGNMGYFYKALGETKKENITHGTIVSGGKAADIRSEDLRKFLDVYWNFANYERVIAPLDAYYNIDETYIKLWNKDEKRSYVIYNNSAIIVGQFGEQTQSHGTEKINYVWYRPAVSNGANALYNAFEKVRHTYFDKQYEGYFEAQREITEDDRANIPTNNILPIDGADDWAKPEIQRAAACNLLVYDMTGKYRENITRKDFCRLIYRLVATEFNPSSDSRMGCRTVIQDVINERQMSDKVNSVYFSDCVDY